MKTIARDEVAEQDRPFDGRTALVVDDDRVTAMLIRRELLRYGFQEVEIAYAVNEASAALSARQFDLVVADWNLRKESGVEIVRSLRERGDATPVILATADGRRSVIEEAIAAGVNCVVLKPIDKSVFYGRIRRLFECAGDLSES